MYLKEKPKNIENKTKDKLADQILKYGQELIDILEKGKLKQKLIEYELVKT